MSHDDAKLITPLNSRLSAYRDESARRRPKLSAAYDALVAHLTALDAGAVGPKVGDAMPAFALPDEDGRLVTLGSLLKNGPAVISFNRGHWCPYCTMELRSLAAIHERISELGASVVAIMPDSAQFTAEYTRKNELPFPILSDIDLGYSLSLGLIFWVGPDIQRMYQEVGISLETYHGNGANFLPMAAKFIVGQDGLVKARRVNLEFRERMEPDAIVSALEALRDGV